MRKSSVLVALAASLALDTACSDLVGVHCLRTNYAYSGTKTGTLWTKTLNSDGSVQSASGSNLATTLALDGGNPQDCWQNGNSQGQALAWIDVSGSEQATCANDPKAILCAPRLCDPQGRTSYQLSGAITTITVVLHDPDGGGCP